MSIIHVTAKYKDGGDFTMELAPKKGAKIDLNKIKQKLENLGFIEVTVKQNKTVVE